MRNVTSYPQWLLPVYLQSDSTNQSTALSERLLNPTWWNVRINATECGAITQPNEVIEAVLYVRFYADRLRIAQEWPGFGMYLVYLEVYFASKGLSLPER